MISHFNLDGANFQFFALANVVTGRLAHRTAKALDTRQFDFLVAGFTEDDDRQIFDNELRSFERRVLDS